MIPLPKLEALESFLNYFRNDFKVKQMCAFDRVKDYIFGIFHSKKSNCVVMSESMERNGQSLNHFINTKEIDFETVLRSSVDFIYSKMPKKEKKDATLNIDDTGMKKSGKHSVGVGSQYCGSVGKIANSQNLVFSSYCTNNIRFLIKGELFLPQKWVDDPERMNKAEIPLVNQIFRTKLEIAKSLVLDAISQKIKFNSVNADSFFGRSMDFLTFIDNLLLIYCADIPNSTKVYLEKPVYGLKTERSRKKTVLTPSYSVKKLFEIHKDKLKEFVVRKTHRKNKLVEIKAKATEIDVWLIDEQGKPVKNRLVIMINSTNDVRYFLSNATKRWSLNKLLKVHSRRYFIERNFQDQKDNIGLDEYQGRKWHGLKNHVALCVLTMLYINWLKLNRKIKEYKRLSVNLIIEAFQMTFKAVEKTDEEKWLNLLRNST